LRVSESTSGKTSDIGSPAVRLDAFDREDTLISHWAPGTRLMKCVMRTVLITGAMLVIVRSPVAEAGDRSAYSQRQQTINLVNACMKTRMRADRHITYNRAMMACQAQVADMRHRASGGLVALGNVTVQPGQ